MAIDYSTTTPILDKLLEPGEGGIINIVAEFAPEYKKSPGMPEWQKLVDYLSSGEVSEVARDLGLYMLGQKEVDPKIAAVGDWYLQAAENEKRLSKVLFKLR
jgi:hypothetical protein